MTERLPNWHSRYVEFINEMRRVPFQWGVSDCGPAWAGRVVEVVTGVENPALMHVGKYRSLKGATRYMQSLGFSNMKDFAVSVFGEAVHPSYAHIGDIAIYADDSPMGFSLGIVNGERVFFRSLTGIGTLDLLSVDSVIKT